MSTRTTMPISFDIQKLKKVIEEAEKNLVKDLEPHEFVAYTPMIAATNNGKITKLNEIKEPSRWLDKKRIIRLERNEYLLLIPVRTNMVDWLVNMWQDQRIYIFSDMVDVWLSENVKKDADC